LSSNSLKFRASESIHRKKEKKKLARAMKSTRSLGRQFHFLFEKLHERTDEIVYRSDLSDDARGAASSSSPSLSRQKNSNNASSIRSSGIDGMSIVHLAPFTFVHVLNVNTNVTSLRCGPDTFTTAFNERLVSQTHSLVALPPNHYCVVLNPVLRRRGQGAAVRQIDGHAECDRGQRREPLAKRLERDSKRHLARYYQSVRFDEASGQALLRHGDLEVRFNCEPFPLFPGEVLLDGAFFPLPVVPDGKALLLCAEEDFADRGHGHRDDDDNDVNEGVHRVAGEHWMIYGPTSYLPRREARVVDVVESVVIGANQGVYMRATIEHVDCDGVTRLPGERWLRRLDGGGAVMPGLHETMERKVVEGIVLQDGVALHLRAQRSFRDPAASGERHAGQEWLLTVDDAPVHVPHPYEEIVARERVVTLRANQYCIVADPIDEATGRHRFGEFEVVRGERSFFVQPGCALVGDTVHECLVLGHDQAVELLVQLSFVDTEHGNGVERVPGTLYRVYGPCQFFQPVMHARITRHLRAALTIESLHLALLYR
jgi:major vault protein